MSVIGPRPQLVRDIESAAEENDMRLYTLEDIVNYLNP